MHDAGRKILGVRRKLGFKHLYSFLGSCGRGEGRSSVRVKAWISNAAEFNARMLWEGLYVGRKEPPLLQRLPLSDLKEEEVGALQSGCKQPLITVPWLCGCSFPCNAHTWSTSASSSPTSGYVNFCRRCESAAPSQWEEPYSLRGRSSIHLVHKLFPYTIYAVWAQNRLEISLSISNIDQTY